MITIIIIFKKKNNRWGFPLRSVHRVHQQQEHPGRKRTRIPGVGYQFDWFQVEHQVKVG